MKFFTAFVAGASGMIIEIQLFFYMNLPIKHLQPPFTRSTTARQKNAGKSSITNAL